MKSPSKDDHGSPKNLKIKQRSRFPQSESLTEAVTEREERFVVHIFQVFTPPGLDNNNADKDIEDFINIPCQMALLFSHPGRRLKKLKKEINTKHLCMN